MSEHQPETVPKRRDVDAGLRTAARASDVQGARERRNKIIGTGIVAAIVTWISTSMLAVMPTKSEENQKTYGGALGFFGGAGVGLAAIALAGKQEITGSAFRMFAGAALIAGAVLGAILGFYLAGAAARDRNS